MMEIDMPDFFNVFLANYHLQGVGGQGNGAMARILYRSEDGRHLAAVGNYPQGLEVGAATEPTRHFEAFYVVRGKGTRTRPDGTAEELKTGDFIIVEPGLHGPYRYEPGFLDVCVFWSATQDPLPGYLLHCVPFPVNV